MQPFFIDITTGWTALFVTLASHPFTDLSIIGLYLALPALRSRRSGG